MTMPQAGEPAPEFTAQAVPGGEVRSADLYRGWSVIYFYPKDMTPGCTKEAEEFTALAADFEALGCRILGVSKDSEQSHQEFIRKHGLRIDLISDPQGQLCEVFGAWGEKKNYGRTYMGMFRNTYLVRPGGTLAQTWKNVRAAGHAQKVLEQLRKLQEAEA